MSKLRSVVVLILVMAALLGVTVVSGQQGALGAVVGGVLLVVFLAACFVGLAMNTGQYEWATKQLAGIVDFVRAAFRHPRKPTS